VNTSKGGFDQQAIIKRLTADSYQHSLCMTSLHTSFKNSLHFLLQVNHSHIIRYIGRIENNMKVNIEAEKAS